MSDWPTGEECSTYLNCRNAGAGCLGCYVPDGGRGPTNYLPRDKKVKHPATVAWEATRAAQRKAAKHSEAAQRGRRSRRKGREGEKEFAKAVGGERVPLSGALGGSYANDVVLPNGLKAEVKRRGAGKWSELYRWVLDEREKPDLVAIRADGQPWLVVQTLDRWLIGHETRNLADLLRAAADQLEGR